MTGRLEAKDSSLDAAAWKEGSETQLDRLADERGEGQEDSFERMQRDSIVRDRVSGISRTLSPRERYILARRLLCDEQETLAEIGRHLNLSRERVRQIEDRLKLKLRRALHRVRAATAAPRLAAPLTIRHISHVGVARKPAARDRPRRGSDSARHIGTVRDTTTVRGCAR